MNRVLFLDDMDVLCTTGLTRRPHKAVKHLQNPLLVNEHPWERYRCQLVGTSVIHDPIAGKFHMYYIASPEPGHYPSININGQNKPGHTTLPAYAESDDGVGWTKPMLGQCTFNDCRDTNLLPFVVGQSFECGAMYDSYERDSSRRFKLLWWGQSCEMHIAKGTVTRENGNAHGFDSVVRDDRGEVLSRHHVTLPGDWFVDVAFSPDGIHWKRHPAHVFLGASDTGQSILFDPRLSRYVAFGRFHARPMKKGGSNIEVGRAVGRIESNDFIHWSDTELVVCPDLNDPPNTQFNSMPVTLYEGLYIGAIELGGSVSLPWLPMQLATSRNGRHWTRVGDRFDFLDLGDEGQWDEGAIRPGSGLLIAGDEMRIYYSTINRKSLPQSRHIDGPRAPGIGMASWRRDGFVSLHADLNGGGGELVTKPFIPDGEELFLNVDAADGQVTVEVCSSHSMTPDAQLPSKNRVSHPLRINATAAPVRWMDGNISNITRPGFPISLRIRMANADLYSFWTE